jgi:arsenate reductase
VRSPSFRVLVLCTGNSARSQIAEALLAARGTGRIEAASAGSRPAPRVHPDALAVLREHGIPWDGHPPRGIDAVIGSSFDLVITVCDDAREACPYLPGARTRVHWGMPDPAAVSDAAARRQAFARTYDVLARRVDALLALPLETLSPQALAQRAQAAGEA